MMISIRKRSRTEWLLSYIFMSPFLFYWLIDFIGLPSVFEYTVDVAWVALLVRILLDKGRMLSEQIKRLIIVISFLIGSSLVGFLAGYQSIFYYLWGLRNNVRFFVIFFAVVLYFNQKNANDILRVLDIVFYVNLIITLFQFFALGIKQDYLGGIFGTSKGSNAYSNVLFILIVTWHILKYMNGMESFRICIIMCFGALVVSAMAEIKMFYLEFVLIVALAALFTKFSSRKIWITIGGFIGLVIAKRLLDMIFPAFADWFRIEKIWESITSSSGYTNTNDMNRITSLIISWSSYLDSVFKKLFGLGLGNCDFATGFDFLTTPFYLKHRYLHYMWFSSSFMLLEMGLVGLVLYIWFFVQIFLETRQMERRKSTSAIYCQYAKIIAIMCPVLIIYDCSLRTEAAFMIYYVLALPFIRNEKENNKVIADDNISLGLQ